MTKRVLILCTGNSCRSQMAEALWQQLARGSWQAASAGARPASYVHPLAVTAMSEIDLDISENESKHVDQYKEAVFDLVITVCDSAKDSCPALAGAKQTLHWPFEDPADATGSEEKKLAVFRRVRDEIRAQIEEYLVS